MHFLCTILLNELPQIYLNTFLFEMKKRDQKINQSKNDKSLYTTKRLLNLNIKK